MNISHEGHVEKLNYGWWEPRRGHVILPKTIGHKKNFVLSPEELAHYDWFLVQAAAKIEKERERVGITMRRLRRGKGFSWEQEIPTCFTLSHVMEFLLTYTKFKLELMHLLVYISGNRVKEKRENEQGSTDQAHEGQSGADPR